jgi:hypothetical protein
MDSKKNVGGKKKLALSRETIRSLNVKSDVRTGASGIIFTGNGPSLVCGITLAGCMQPHTQGLTMQCK